MGSLPVQASKPLPLAAAEAVAQQRTLPGPQSPHQTAGVMGCNLQQGFAWVQSPVEGVQNPVEGVQNPVEALRNPPSTLLALGASVVGWCRAVGSLG
jgi:hypothetical protein